MADIALGSLGKIVEISLKIKEAVPETVKQNEECGDIQRCVARLSAFLREHDEKTETMKDEEMLEDLAESVTECHRKHNFGRFLGAGDMAKEQGRVQDDIVRNLQLGNFATNVQTTSMVANIQKSASGPERELITDGFTSLSFLEAITKDFSEQNNIGSGGFGVVYKGVLRDGQTIAVKKLQAIPAMDDSQFHDEFNALRKLKHKNIVRLVGYCHEMEIGKHVGTRDREICLVFEYMENKRMESIINGSRFFYCCTTRYQIIKGICQGLHYLHGGQRMFHLDLKPDSILLDSHMTPRISDFGLSRFFEETSDTNRLCGKMGYMCPEYIDHVSTKCDVFSLGVIILEIITGRTSTSTPPNLKESNQWAYENRRNRWMFESSSKQIKRLNQSCLGTRKSTKATSTTVYSTQRAVHDILIMDSGGAISATVDATERKLLLLLLAAAGAAAAAGLQLICCWLAAATAAGAAARAFRKLLPNSMDLVLDSNGLMLAAALSVHQHPFQNNLTDEQDKVEDGQSDKPRSDRAAVTNYSEETTRSPMANKPTDDEAENPSDPDSCVSERDTMVVGKRSNEWFVATGAAHHATGDRDAFGNLVDVENDGLCVHAADGTPMPVCGRGDVVTDDVVLRDVYYVPRLRTNLVSVGQLAGLDYCVGFGRGACVITSAAGRVIGRAHARGDGLYEVDFLRLPLGIP